MPVIQTVLGCIDIEQVNHAQCHEHIWLNKGVSFEINPALCIDDYNKSLEELVDYKKNGGNLIVDAQPVGCGRDAWMLKELSSHSKVSIVSSTGFHKMLFYPKDHWIHDISTEVFAELMISEIEVGMFIDGDKEFPQKRIVSKAGMIKIAGDKEGLSERYVRLYRSAAIAAVKTGASIQCHIEIDGQGDEICDLLLLEGLSSDKIILAHMDRADKKQILKVLDRGVYIQLDTIGRFKYHSDEEEIKLIKELIASGYGDQLLIGLDTTRARLLSYGGVVGLTYILKEFKVKLLQSNISKNEIDKMIKYNPRKALIYNRC